MVAACGYSIERPRLGFADDFGELGPPEARRFGIHSFGFCFGS